MVITLHDTFNRFRIRAQFIFRSDLSELLMVGSY